MMPMRPEPAALGLESSILPLSHCAPYTVEVSKVFRQNNTIFKKKYDLTPLDMYNGLSQVYLSKQKEEYISIQNGNNILTELL